MIKLLEGIDEIGEEVRCKECSAIVHVGDHDWKPCTYYLPYDRKIRRNYFVDCPKCYCTINRFEDN